MARMTKDDRDSVQANITDLGLYGAMVYAKKRLPREVDPRIRRVMVLTIHETARRLLQEIRLAKRLVAAQRRFIWTG